MVVRLVLSIDKAAIKSKENRLLLAGASLSASDSTFPKRHTRRLLLLRSFTTAGKLFC